MKFCCNRLLLGVLAVGLASPLFARSEQDRPQVTLCPPSNGKHPMPRDQFVTLVIEGAALFYDGKPIPHENTVEFVNELLKTNGVSYIGVYAREGTKFGDLVNAIDLLRETTAKNIGVSTLEMPTGLNP